MISRLYHNLDFEIINYLIAVCVRETALPLTVATAGVVIPKAEAVDVNAVALVQVVGVTLSTATKVSPVTNEAAHELAAALAAASAVFSLAVSAELK